MSRADLQWMDEASCAVNGIHVNEFFLEKGKTIHKSIRKMCSECPVKAECLAYALEFPDMTGYFANTNWNMRNILRRKAAAAK